MAIKDVMRDGPHKASKENRNNRAPPYIIAGTEAAIHWGKAGPPSMMPGDSAEAYGVPHGLSQADIDAIMDLIVENVPQDSN